MNLISTYMVKIKDYNHIFDSTIKLYRAAVDWFLDAILKEWDLLSQYNEKTKTQLSLVEHLTITTKNNRNPKYDFCSKFYKFPCYLRRSVINEALGKVSSYKSNLANDQDAGTPSAGHCMPAMYRDNMFVRTGTYTARIKVFKNNTWIGSMLNLTSPILISSLVTVPIARSVLLLF